MTVQFKEIPEFTGYKVGTDGSVWSCLLKGGARVNRKKFGTEWHKLKLKNRSDQPQILLYRESKPFPKSVGRLVLEAFIGPCPEGMECCHNDGNPLNNALVNLRWDTHENNMKDKVIHQTQPRGEDSHFSKLTEEQVLQIRKLLSDGHPQKTVGKLFNVGQTAIHKIFTRKSWSHI